MTKAVDEHTLRDHLMRMGARAMTGRPAIAPKSKLLEATAAP